MRYFLSILVLLVSSLVARADEFYCMIFATDNSNPYYYCHVWGTFVQMKGDKVVKDVTISWAPPSFTLNKVQGHHLSLETSFGLSRGHVTCVWGPYEIKEDFFRRAEVKHDTSGYYKFFDINSGAENCIHCLSNISGQRCITGCRYGRCAASEVVGHFNRLGLIHKSNDVALSGLHLERYALRRM